MMLDGRVVDRPLVMAACALVLALGVDQSRLPAAELHVGATTVDITPNEPVALDGQRHVRISAKPASSIQAAVLALESRDKTAVLDQAVIVACDLVAIREGILQQVRDKLLERVPELDRRKIFLCATHTHTAPVTVDGKYVLPESGVMQPSAYADWLTTQIADGIVAAWQQRSPGKVAWGQSQAVLAQNRRPYYEDGTAVMYGKTDSSAFRGIEGYEDHAVDVLYFWDAQDKLLATAVNVPCPSQEIGGTSAIHADFWDATRRQLRERYGSQLHVLAWTGAAGDVTSRPAFGRAAEERMRKLRGNLSRLDELARRIVNAWEEAFAGAQHDIRTEVAFQHSVHDIQLPFRQVTREEFAEATTLVKRYQSDPKEQWNYLWHQRVVDRYEEQQAGRQGMYAMELHALRLGDVAIASNDFELYTDFGIQIKARSPALQTFIIQLAGPGSYLPTERAVRHGGYGAVIQSSRVGPDGGQVLVENTVAALQSLWSTEARQP